MSRGRPSGPKGRPRVLLATRSSHKLAEIRRILRDVPVDLVSLSEAGIPLEEEEAGLEPHESFAENALSKARHFHRRSDLPTLADDSGLCVDTLEGGPGVRTKRFAPPEMVERWGRDEANNRFLLMELEGLPEARREAHYRCAVAAVGGPGGTLVVEGTVHGRIAEAPRGSGGFGYDPLFIPRGERDSYAELPPEAKEAGSHRARAFRKVRPWLERLAEEGGITEGDFPETEEPPKR